MNVTSTTLADLKEAAKNLSEVNEKWIVTLKELAKEKEVIQAALIKYEDIGLPGAINLLKEDEAEVPQEALVNSALELYAFLTQTRNLFIEEFWENMDAVKTATVKTKKGSSGWHNYERVNQDLIAARSSLKKLIIPLIESELTGLEFQAENHSLTLGQKQKVTVTGTFSDNSTLDLTHSVKWTTNPEGIISIEKGLISALSEGLSIVTITWENQKSVEQNFEVITNFTTTEEAQTPMQDNNKMSTFTDVKEPFGQEPAFFVEEVTVEEQIYVPAENPDEYIKEIEVYPQNITLQPGETAYFEAIVTFSDGNQLTLTDRVTWTSFDEDIIVIDDGTSGPNGQVTAIGPGTAGIVASLDGVNSDPSTVVVSAKVTAPKLVISAGQVTLETGSTQKFVAEIETGDGSSSIADNVTWLSSNPEIMEITGGSSSGMGLGKAIKPGTTGIRAIRGQLASNKIIMTVSSPAQATSGPNLTQITLSSPRITLKPGQTYQFRAGGTQLYYGTSTMVDITDRVNWVSSNTDYVKFDPANPGLVTAIKPGIATITASLNGSYSITGTVTVAIQTYTKIELRPSNPSLLKGDTRNFKAVGILADGSEDDITNKANWSSENRSIIKVENNDPDKGLARAVVAGRCKITASFGSQRGSTQVTVKPGPGLFLQELQTVPHIDQEVITQTTRLLSNDNPNFNPGKIAGQVEALIAGWEATIDQHIENYTPSGGNPDPQKVNGMLELHSTLKTLYARLDKFAGDDVAGSSFSTY